MSELRPSAVSARCLASAYHLPRNFVFAVALAVARGHKRRLEAEAENSSAHDAKKMFEDSMFEDSSKLSGPEVEKSRLFHDLLRPF
jgi:hypothetical protein